MAETTTEDSLTKLEAEIKAGKVKWQNRRRMAWLSLISMVVMTCFILFTNLASESRLVILNEVITWYYLTCASIVGAYMGFTTYASIKGK